MNETDFREQLQAAAAGVPPVTIDPEAIAGRARWRIRRSVAGLIGGLALVTFGATLAVGAVRGEDPPAAGNVITHPAGACDERGLAYARSLGTVHRVTGRYPTNMENLSAWLAVRNGPGGPGVFRSQWHERHPNERVDVCVYAGVFAVQKGPPSGATSGSQTALSIIIPEGEPPVLDAVGYGPFTWVAPPAPA